jgi:MFS family permease
MSVRYFYGWNVVGATFTMALFSFGLGFYGLAVYVATLQGLHGWSAAAVSAPVTVYYVAGALLTASIGDLYERLGPRVVVAGGSIAMAAGVAALGSVTRPWQLYPVFVVMSLGWGSMSGAAINIVLAPWFERRRGLAVSIAFNGATLGGVIVTPALILLIGVAGFPRALGAAAAVLLAVLLPVAAGVMRRGPEELGLGPDGDPRPSALATASAGTGRRGRGNALRTWRFWSVSAPFALGLAAQVGVLTHLVAVVTPLLGAGGSARAVSATTAAAVVGRLVTGCRHRSLEPTPRGERNARHPDRGPGRAGVGTVRRGRLHGLRTLRPGRREFDHPARPHSRCRVAAGAVQRARWPGGRHQSVHLRLRAVARGRHA